MKSSAPFLLALVVCLAGSASASAVSCNNKHPELCRKADLVAEIAHYGTINAAGQFVPNPGVASSARTHFMNLATNSPLTVGQLVMMVKTGAISADGSFNPASPFSLGFDPTPFASASTPSVLPPVGNVPPASAATAKAELAKLGTFDASGQFTPNPGVTANEATNFFAVNPVTGKASALNVGQFQLMIRLGAIRPDGSNDRSAFASAIVYRAPAPPTPSGAAVISPSALTASSFDNLRAGRPGAALASAQIDRVIDASGRPKDPSAFTNFYRLQIVDRQQVYVQITQRELAQSIAGGLIGRDGTATQNAGTGWGTAGGGSSGDLPVVVFLAVPTAPGPMLVPGLAPAAAKGQAPPLLPYLVPNPVPRPPGGATPSLASQPVPRLEKSAKWASTSPEKRVKNESRVDPGKPGARKDVLDRHFAGARIEKPSDCVTGRHGRQAAGADNHCLLTNDVVMECLTSGQRRRVSRGPDGTLDGTGLTESFRSMDDDVNSAPANHVLSSACAISVQRPYL